MTLRLHLLGQPQIYRGNEAVTDFASEKTLALLCYLAVTQETFSRAQLEGLFWGDFPAEKAQTNLRTALYNLNKLLGNVIQATRKTVAFDTTQPFTLDTQQFEAALTGRNAAALPQALSLYRGDFLSGLYLDDAPEFEAWLLLKREHLRLMLLNQLEQWLPLGNPAQRRVWLHRLLELEPWREAAHRQLMLLLARQGELNGALRQYEQCRRILTEELGVEPMPETSALYERLLALRDEPPQHHLPQVASSLVGRQGELNELDRLLTDPDCRLITLLGPGGIGKTRLALAAAAQQTYTFLDGVHFVSLAPLNHVNLIPAALGQVLGLSFNAKTPESEQMLTYLRPRELLLVLDNLEHLPDAAEYITALLEQSPALKCLVTSRQKLDLRQEFVLRLEGLPYPDEADALTSIMAYPALQLFQQQTQHTNPGWMPVEDEWQAVTRICQLLAGVPLAIELAAAQMSGRTCVQIAQAIADNLDHIAVTWRDIPPRQRSLRAAFDHSWQLLTPAEQETLCRVTVFQDGFTDAAATTITHCRSIDLQALVSKSLLKQQAGRYDLHPLVRQFASEHLALHPEWENETRTAHVRYFLHHLSQPPGTVLGTQLVLALRSEQSNIRLAWQQAVKMGMLEALEQAAYGLCRYYEGLSLFQAGENLLAAAAQVVRPCGPSLVLGHVLTYQAVFLWHRGRIAEALPLAEEGAILQRQFGTAVSQAFVLNLLGVLNIYKGDFAAATLALQGCADLYRAQGDVQLVKPLANLGSLYMRAGRYDEAVAVLQEGLELARRIHDERGMTHFLNNLGAIHLIKEELAEAKHYFMTCLPLCESTDNRYVNMVALMNLGEIAYKEGDFAAAQTYLQKSVALGDALDRRANLVPAYKWLALAQYGLGEAAAAWQTIAQALHIGQETQVIPYLLDALHGVAVLLINECRFEEAYPVLMALWHNPATEQQYRVEVEHLAQAAGLQLMTGDEGMLRPLDEVLTPFLTGT